MKVHAVSYCFPPAPYAQSPQVARFLGMTGCDVVVHAADEDGDDSLLEAVASGTIIVRHGWGRWGTLRRLVRRALLRQRLARPDAYRPWADRLTRALRSAQAPKGADVLVTFGQPMSDHLVGLDVKRRTGVRWIAHFSDPWIGNQYTPLGPATGAVQRRQEGAVVAAADLVVVTTEEQAAMVRQRHGLDHVVVVPHVHGSRPLPPVGGSGPVIVRYLGAFYGPRSPSPLLDALTALVERGLDPTSVRVEMIGPGRPPAPEPRLPVGLVSWRPAVPYAASLDLMSTADLLLVVDAPAARSVFLPSKLVDYLGSRRPIVAITPEGPAAQLVRAAGGLVADPADPDAVAEALAAAINEAAAWRGRAWGDEAVVAAHAAAQVGPLVRRLLVANPDTYHR